MRKVLFLMFLLLLMGLGAASVKAQVRIGGNGQPHTAAVLDLNVDNTDAGNKGALALPRISLGALSGASANLNGVAPIKGMLVYNTNATLGAGLYYWSGDSSKWVKVINSDFTVPISKLQTAMADSGKVLQSDGSSLYFTPATHIRALDFTSTQNLPAYGQMQIFQSSDLYGICVWWSGYQVNGEFVSGTAVITPTDLHLWNPTNMTVPPSLIGIRCLTSGGANSH